MKNWSLTKTNFANERYIGILQLRDEVHFEVVHVQRNKNQHKAIDPSERKNYPVVNRIVFGGACNTGFIESGYMDIEDHETIDEALQELHEELEVYYRDGKQSCNRIVCNERM